MLGKNVGTHLPSAPPHRVLRLGDVFEAQQTARLFLRAYGRCAKLQVPRRGCRSGVTHSFPRASRQFSHDGMGGRVWPTTSRAALTPWP